MASVVDYQDLIVADDPLLYWPLNEGGSGSVGDLSGNGFTGTITAGLWAYPPAPTRRGDYCYCLTSATASAVAMTGTLDTLNNVGLSIEFWIYLGSSPSSGAPRFSGGTTALFINGASSSSLQAGATSASVLQATSQFTSGSWQHWVFTQDAAGSSLLYKNGSAIVGPTARTRSSADTSNFVIGSAASLTWYLQHLAIYGYVLTPSQITERTSMAMDVTVRVTDVPMVVTPRAGMAVPPIQAGYRQHPHQRWPAGIYVPRELDGNDLFGELDFNDA